MTETADYLDALDAEGCIIELCSFLDASGAPHYAYVRMSPSAYCRFRRRNQHEPLLLGDYGEILCAGPGTDPPPEVAEAMAEAFGAIEDLEQLLQEQLHEWQKIKLY